MKQICGLRNNKMHGRIIKIILIVVIYLIIVFIPYIFLNTDSIKFRDPDLITKDKMLYILINIAEYYKNRDWKDELPIAFRKKIQQYDPWGHPILIDFPSTNTIRLISVGKDDKLNTKDDIVMEKDAKFFIDSE